MEDALRRYFAELLFFTILPIVIIVVLVLLYFIRTCFFKADSKRCRDQTILGMLLAVYVLLPPIATTIFRGIPCDDDWATRRVEGPLRHEEAQAEAPLRPEWRDGRAAPAYVFLFGWVVVPRSPGPRRRRVLTHGARSAAAARMLACRISEIRVS